MKPVDIRDINFERLAATLSPKRQAVWRAWLAHGERTTRELAMLAGMDILEVRPRTTELYQCGLLMLHDWIPGGDEHCGMGIYRARTAAEWEIWAAAQRNQIASHQLQMI